MFAVAVICASFAQLPPLTEKTVDEYLPLLHAEQPDYFERLETIAKALLDVPFAPDPLGEGSDAPYDRDPAFNLSRVDGFSYVDQCLALAATHTLEEATAAVNAIRYAGGQVDFLHRNHFLVEDWAVNNTFVTNITGSLGMGTRSVMRFVQKNEHFKDTPMKPLFEKVKEEGITINYLRFHDMSRKKPVLPDNSLIAFIGMQSTYLAANCGLHFLEGENGAGKIYYASPSQGRVVAESLEEVIAIPEYVGILVYSLHPERMAFLKQPAPEPEHAESPNAEEKPSS